MMFAAGEVWKENRKFVLTKLRERGFSERSTMEAHISDELSFFFKHFDQLRAGNGDVVSMHRAFKLTSLNILWRTLCGTRFAEDDDEVQVLMTQLEKVLTAIRVGTHPMYAFPFLTKIPGFTPHQDLMKNVGMIRDFFRVSLISLPTKTK
jgi:hypothetical protein